MVELRVQLGYTGISVCLNEKKDNTLVTGPLTAGL